MIEEWLEYEGRDEDAFTTFRIVDVSEIIEPDDNLKNYLGKEILEAYRNLDTLKVLYETQPQAKLDEYIDKYIFPSDYMGNKIVKPGDFGEIVASLIVSYFLDFEVPLRKLRWKFNQNRAVFCTDMLAHNKGDTIQDLYYYEIKTRQTIQKKEGRHFSLDAHDGLLKDHNSGQDGIADFLMRLYAEKEDYDSAKKYHDLILNPGSYNKYFELFFIIDKSVYLDQILDDLEAMPPALSPLNVTLVLIDNFRAMVDECYNRSRQAAYKYVYG